MSTGLAANEVEKFTAALSAFVRVSQDIVTADWTAHGYTHDEPPVVYVEDSRYPPFAKMWVRVLHRSVRGQLNTIHAFIHVPTGGVFYPASWKKPFIPKAGLASGARGNIYDAASIAKCMGPYGVKTLDRMKS